MIAWAVETVVATTLLMLLVLALRAPVRRAVGPQVAYALWALPALRMLLPPLPAALRPSIAPIGAATEPGTIMLGVPVAEVSALPPGWGLEHVPVAIVAVWALGALVFAGWHVIAYARFCARLRAGARRRVDLAGGRVAMIESAAAAGPLAFGVWRKYVAFPADFAERYDAMERDLALAHELGHHARGDLAANWAALAMLAFHWFNPVAWRAFRAFRADQEMACDALVLAGRHTALRHAYGRAIVKSAHGGAVSAACHLHTVGEIKGRLRMLTHHQKPSRRTARTGLAGIAALGLAGLALTASGTRAAENLKAKVEDRIGVSLDQVELPALPLVPAAAQEPAAPTAPTDMRQDRRRHVYRSKDGKRTVIVDHDMPDVARIEADARRIAAEATRVHVPEIRSIECGGDGPVTQTVYGGDGRVTTTTICTDRIERQVAYAEVARSEGLRAAAHARAEAYRDAEAGREASRRARAEVLREAGAARAIAHREAERARAEGLREAARARAEAMRDAEAWRAEGRRMAEEARAMGAEARAIGARSRDRARAFAE